MEGPRLKIARADEHLAELGSEIRAFFEQKPYEVVVEEHPKGRKNYSVRVHKNPPMRWAAIVGDAIHNLRSALDLVVWQLVLAAGKTPDKHDEFFVSKSEAAFVSGALPKLNKRIGSDPLKVIHNLKPYKGGNEAFWRLHHLDIADKHHALILVDAAFTHLAISVALTINDSEDEPFDWVTTKMKPVFPLEDGKALTTLTTTTTFVGWDEDELETLKAEDQAKFKFVIALYEPGVMEIEPIPEALSELRRTVAEAVELFAPFLDG